MEVLPPFFGKNKSFLEKAGGQLLASFSLGGLMPQVASAT